MATVTQGWQRRGGQENRGKQEHKVTGRGSRGTNLTENSTAVPVRGRIRNGRKKDEKKKKKNPGKKAKNGMPKSRRT